MVSRALHSAVRKTAAFTLIEIVISVFILMLLIALAVPSLTGVLSDKRLRQSLDRFNRIVHQAQELSLSEHRAYLLVWNTKNIELRPEILHKGDNPKPAAQLVPQKGESFNLTLTAALTKEAPAEWVFWPTGTCEPADVKFVGRDGTWTVSYSPLTARAQIIAYAAR